MCSKNHWVNFPKSDILEQPIAYFSFVVRDAGFAPGTLAAVFRLSAKPVFFTAGFFAAVALTAGFLAAVLFAAAVLAVASLAAGFFTAGFFAVAAFAAGFLAAVLFAAVGFFAAVVLAVAALAAGFFTAGFFLAASFTTGFLAAVLFAAGFFVAVSFSMLYSLFPPSWGILHCYITVYTEKKVLATFLYSLTAPIVTPVTK
jgi:hypothetical protein